MLETTLTLTTALFLAVTLVQCWRNPMWWVRDWEFPRLQLAVLLTALLLVQLALASATPWYLGLATVTALCLVYQLWWILPYTPFHSKEVSWAKKQGDRPRISILAANVLTPNRQAGRLLEIVREHSPDVLVLLETDKWWDQQLQALDQDYPYSLRQPMDNLYGMHLFSRLALKDAQIRFLVQKGIPSMHARVQINEQLSVRMHFLHPAPPSPTENDASSERDAELLVLAQSIRHTVTPTIVAGDLNDVAWSPTTRLFRKISNLLDPRIGRGMFNTFHAQHRFLRWPLDHVFHSDHFKVVRIIRLPAFGSDHFPLFIELQFDESNMSVQQSLPADPSDRREARRKVAHEDVGKSDVPVPGR